MKVLLFAEGSRSIGVGHQVRSAALARALLRQGHQATLAARALPGSAHAWAWSGLACATAAPELSARAAAVDALRRERPDVLVVDHAELGEDALAELGREAALALIDDVPATRAARARLVVNSAPGVPPAEYPDSAVALGPAHALVRAEFAATAAGERQARLLVALGSAANLDTDAILQALLEASPFDVDWVGSPPASAPASRVAVLPRQDASGMAALMARSRMGLFSASSVCLEAACAQLPFVAVETAPDQQRLARGLASLEVPVLQPAEATRRERLSDALERAGAGRLRVDGRGAERVAARVAEAAIPTNGLRPAVWSDAAALLAWANDPETRRRSFEQRSIREDEHAAWLAAKLMDPEARLFVELAEGEAVGSARLDRTGAAALVSLAVAPERRGRGLGGRLLASLHAWAKAAGFAARLEALVREDNALSLRLFERAGYLRAGRVAVAAQPAIRFERAV